MQKKTTKMSNKNIVILFVNFYVAIATREKT